MQQVLLQNQKDQKKKTKINGDGTVFIARGKLRGTYDIYRIDEKRTIPVKYRLDYEKCSIGDWILSNDAIVAQVLDIRLLKQRGGLFSKAIITALGIDIVSNYLGERQSLKLLRPRRYFWSLATDVEGDHYTNKKLTINDRRLLLHFAYTGDVYIAWEKVTGRKVTLNNKSIIRYKFNRLLEREESTKFMKESIDSILSEKGVTARSWVEKMVDSVDGKVDSQVKFNVWMMIGKLIKEIRDEIFPDEKRNELPPGAVFPTAGQITDGKFTEVCKVCNGTRRVKSTILETGQEVEVTCPVCANGQTIEVKQSNELKLKV